MKYKAILFDLDGTTLNTIDDLTDGVNYALSKYDLPLRTADEVTAFTSAGLAELINQSMPYKDHPLSTAVLADFKEYYAIHSADKTHPYEGITELFEKLKDRGYLVAIVSNKLNPEVQKLCNKFFDGLIDSAIGLDERIPKKPAPDMINIMLERLNLNVQDILYVGDSEVDIQFAENAGADYVSVTWGYRSPEFLLKHNAKQFVNSPMEILNILK